MNLIELTKTLELAANQNGKRTLKCFSDHDSLRWKTQIRNVKRRKGRHDTGAEHKENQTERTIKLLTLATLKRKKETDAHQTSSRADGDWQRTWTCLPVWSRLVAVNDRLSGAEIKNSCLHVNTQA